MKLKITGLVVANFSLTKRQYLHPSITASTHIATTTTNTTFCCYFTAATATRVKAATINSTTHAATAATIKTDTTTTAANANYAKGKFFEYTKCIELSWNTLCPQMLSKGRTAMLHERLMELS